MTFDQKKCPHAFIYPNNNAVMSSGQPYHPHRMDEVQVICPWTSGQVAVSSEMGPPSPSSHMGLTPMASCFLCRSLPGSARALCPFPSISVTIFSFLSPMSSSKLCLQLLISHSHPSTFPATESMHSCLSSGLWMLPGPGHLLILVTDPHGICRHWCAFIQRLNTASAKSTSSKPQTCFLLGIKIVAVGLF